jgi:zinc transport system ATP-binding protein
LTALLTVHDASFAYDGKIAVEGLDFALAAGDYLCVIGENGSGKSTLVGGILGLKQPLCGSIVYEESLKQSQIGYLPQQHFAHGGFPASVLEVVLSGRLGHKGAVPFYTKQDRKLAREALELVGAGALERHWFGGLSGGQRQRVLLARALSTAPDGLRLLILDEPMNGLDPHARADLYARIQRLNSEEHLTVIMVTHDVNTAVHFANRILLLDACQLFYGTPDAFKESESGLDLMRDACGGHCAICGFSHFEEGHRHG